MDHTGYFVIMLLALALVIMIILAYLDGPTKQKYNAVHVVHVASCNTAIQEDPVDNYVWQPLDNTTIAHPMTRPMQCLGHADVRKPANEREEKQRAFIHHFISSLVERVHANNMNDPVCVEFVSKWQGNVEIFYGEGVKYFCDYGCFYFNPKIFESDSLHDVCMLIVTELSKGNQHLKSILISNL